MNPTSTYNCLWALAFLIFPNACLKRGENDRASVPEKPSSASTTKIPIIAGNAPQFAAVAGAELDLASDGFWSLTRSRYERNLNRLSIQSSVKDIPYAGAWYPEVSGGTNANGALGKYDSAFGSTAVAWEASNHKRAQNTADANWAGHCNGFSAASQRHLEPPAAVKRRGPNGQTVEFSRGDIKALLAEIYMSAKAINLGGNRCESDAVSTNPFSRPDKTKMGPCEDVNPAAMHLAITNWIGGVKPHTIIMDLSIGREVWNYPFYAYRCTNCESGRWKTIPGDQREQVLKIIAGSQSTTSTEYVFNPNAKSFADVRLELKYVKATANEVLDSKESETKTYRYILELNEAGEVIGGEWAAESREDHPDRVWLSLEATRGSGDKRFSNPQVDPDIVLALWEESFKIAGKRPNRDYVEPVWETSWGRYSDFIVEVDGAQSGAIFLGKRIDLRLKRVGERWNNADIDIKINTKSIQTFKNSGSDDLRTELKGLIPGLNELSLSFAGKDGSREEHRLMLIAMP